MPSDRMLVSKSFCPNDWFSTKTTSEHHVSEHAVMPLEIEQLPHMTGFLKAIVADLEGSWASSSSVDCCHPRGWDTLTCHRALTQDAVQPFELRLAEAHHHREGIFLQSPDTAGARNRHDIRCAVE
jgi:hypothetical protein